MVQNKLSKEDVLTNASTLSFPTSVIEFLQEIILEIVQNIVTVFIFYVYYLEHGKNLH